MCSNRNFILCLGWTHSAPNYCHAAHTGSVWIASAANTNSAWFDTRQKENKPQAANSVS